MHNRFTRFSALLLAVMFAFGTVVLAVPVTVNAAEGEYTVSGVWTLNNSVDWSGFPVGLIENIAGTCYCDNFYTYPFDSIWFSEYGGSDASGYGIYVYCTLSNYLKYMCVYKPTGPCWGDVTYFDFGETPQIVSAEFYSWMSANSTFPPPPPEVGPLVEVVTDLKEQAILDQVLAQVIAILPIGLACLVGYKGFRKGLNLLQEVLHRA